MAERSTRKRILEAALELFARRGFAGTSVGEIEAAAGLSPRAGGLYKHFRSKEDLLEAAFAERIAEIEAFNARFELTPLGDTRAELTLASRWALSELRRERALVRIVMKEGERLPGLALRFDEAIVQRGLRLAEGALRRYAEERGAEFEDLRAAAAATLASIVGFNLQQTLFGDEFAEIDEERFAIAWVEMTLALIEQLERRKADV